MDCPVHAGDSLSTVLGVLAAVVTGSVTAFTWFAATYSYRTDKKTMVTEVVNHLKVADIATDSAAGSAQAAASHEGTLFSKKPMATPVMQNRNLQRISSTPSRQMSSMQSSSVQSADSDAVQNPLLLVPGSPQTAATSHRIGSTLQDQTGPSKEMQAVAKQITVRCLRRWDGFLGIRASSDGVGRRSGVWKDKFDGVHYAVLLLAVHRLNVTLDNAAQEPGKLRLT